MKLIIGLGNPGEKYVNTRHNTGYIVVDKISKLPKLPPCRRAGKNSKQIKIFKSKSFMNDSGSFVRDLTIRYPLSANDLYIIHDDLDLPLGTWKIQYAKGPKDHGGINSIEQILDTKNFWRVRVGVDPTTPLRLRSGLRGASQGSDFVLADFLPEEKIILDKVINEICKKLATL